MGRWTTEELIELDERVLEVVRQHPREGAGRYAERLDLPYKHVWGSLDRMARCGHIYNVCAGSKARPQWMVAGTEKLVEQTPEPVAEPVCVETPEKQVEPTAPAQPPTNPCKAEFVYPWDRRPGAFSLDDPGPFGPQENPDPFGLLGVPMSRTPTPPGDLAQFGETPRPQSDLAQFGVPLECQPRAQRWVNLPWDGSMLLLGAGDRVLARVCPRGLEPGWRAEIYAKRIRDVKDKEQAMRFVEETLKPSHRNR